MVKLISRDVLRELAGDSKQVCLPDNSILTPSAKDFAAQVGLTVMRGNVELMVPSVSKADFRRLTQDKKWSDQAQPVIIEASQPDHGMSTSVIRDTVQKVMGEMIKPVCENPQFAHISSDEVIIEPFAKAPAGQNIKMTDVITARESNLAAGFMIFERSILPWQLTYDEIDFVVEGDFDLRVGETIHKCKPGDVVAIPKGTSVIFGSTSYAKVFYVTYPANWEELNN